MMPHSRTPRHGLVWLLWVLVGAACGGPAQTGLSSRVSAADAMTGLPASPVTEEQVLRGRQLLISHACSLCHGGSGNPTSDRWLAGNPGDTIAIGPFRAWPRNLTPDQETGLGRFSERQIFNALRYGLRPSATADVEITSPVPGQGNHPANPNYLSPAMPWLWWRYMRDQELWDIVAYLKHGVRPVGHRVPDSEAPPDFWASEFAAEKIGTHILPSFPAEHEELRAPERLEQILRGRRLVATRVCSGCHGGALSPDQEGWLAGMRSEVQEFRIGAFKTRPRNVTPDNTTGLGRFTERQIFNALRYGLRPGETPDVEITSATPGEGNHPLNPKYLAPPMPWTDWRHMADEELWAIAAYLKNGVKPVRHRVEDSEGPPDFWVSEYTVEKYGTYPAPVFPTAREQRP